MEAFEFHRHMPVYTADGRHLGRVEEVGHALDWIHVQQGHFVITDWYIPSSEIESASQIGVRLSCTVGHLRRSGRRVPPEALLARQGATPGYEYTNTRASNEGNGSSPD